MADFTDDPVVRIVESAMAAQTRLLLAYLGQMRKEVTDQVTRAVRSEMAGEQIYMGKGAAELVAKRNAAMRADRAAGMSIRAIAKKHLAAKSWVAEVVSGVSVPNRTAGDDNGDCSIGA